MRQTKPTAIVPSRRHVTRRGTADNAVVAVFGVRRLDAALDGVARQRRRNQSGVKPPHSTVRDFRSNATVQRAERLRPKNIEPRKPRTKPTARIDNRRSSAPLEQLVRPTTDARSRDATEH